MRKKLQLPPQEYLAECFDYNEKTGDLTWKTRPVSHFSNRYRSAEGCCNNWNSKLAGKAALNSIAKAGGYRFGTLDGVKGIKAHRVIWKLIHGKDANQFEIDHINGIPSDNRIENLRLVTRSENARNLGKQVRTKSGVFGVRWNAATNNWRVTITRNKKRYQVGMFDDLDKAIEARKAFEIKLGFHTNHGNRRAHINTP